MHRIKMYDMSIYPSLLSYLLTLIILIVVGYDCPILPRMFNFVRVIGGASLQAASALTERRTRRAINWCGGWHHAQRYEYHSI